MMSSHLCRALYCMLTHNHCTMTAQLPQFTTGTCRFIPICPSVHCSSMKIHCKFTTSAGVQPNTGGGSLLGFIVPGLEYFWQKCSQAQPKRPPITCDFCHKITDCKKNKIGIHWYQQCITFPQHSKCQKAQFLPDLGYCIRQIIRVRKSAKDSFFGSYNLIEVWLINTMKNNSICHFTLLSLK